MSTSPAVVVRLMLCVFAVTLCSSTRAGADPHEGAADTPPLTAEVLPRARVETTLGSFDIELYLGQAPITVAQILRLIDEDYYDGLIFHRVAANFVIQTGGYERGMVEREAPPDIANESFNGLSNTKGTLAMARLDHPDSANSQWFVNVKNNTRLDARRNRPGYTVFGRVISGWDVVVAIELTNTVTRNGFVGVPETPIEIVDIKRLQ
ncbi:MAG: peptidylprolyl isomerase [Pseudomonadota bacterium]